MWQMAVPLISSIVSIIEERGEGIAKASGVDVSVVDRVTKAMESYLTQDEKLLAQAMACVNDARKHDVETFDKADLFANRLRSLVRPVCTFVALGWYVYARVMGVQLIAEDYAIVGGVLAFWFGFRPFEKRM